MGRTVIRAEQVDENTLQDADASCKIQVEETAGEDKIRFDTSGTERMIILNDGAVGIGITAPANPLSVYADASSKYVALIDNDASSAGHGLKVTSDGTGSGTYLFDIESASSTVFRVRGDGRVGIGKVSGLPGAVLTVSSSNEDGDIAVAHKIQHIGDSDTYVQFEDDAIHIVCGDRQMIKFVQDSTEKITINNGGMDVDLQIKGEGDANLIRTDAANGKVGISTSAAGRKLDVLDATNPQIRLTHSTSPSKYVDLHATEAGDFEVTGSASNSHMKFICPNGDAAMIIQSNAGDGNAELGFSVSAGSGLEWSVGVDDGDSDKFKIGNSTVGTSTRMTITTSGYVGIGTTSPHSSFHAAASQAGVYESFTSTTKSLSASHFIVDYVGTSNTDTVVTLPSPSGIAGRLYHILNNSAGGGDVKIVTPSGVFLGANLENATSDEVTLEGDDSSRQMQSVSIVSTGSDWFILHDGRRPESEEHNP